MKILTLLLVVTFALMTSTESQAQAKCFPKGTMIKMADGTTKPIENITQGDKVLSYDIEKKALTTAHIVSYYKVMQKRMIRYSFDGGVQIIATEDHPFYAEKKGWVSTNPQKTKWYQNFSSATMVANGDMFVTVNTKKEIKPLPLKSSEAYDRVQLTYSITALDAGFTYFANGFLVGIEKDVD